MCLEDYTQSFDHCLRGYENSKPIIIIEYVPTEDEFLYKAKAQADTFVMELYDLTARLNMSLCAPLTSAGEDLINALAKLELLKQSL